MHYKCVIASQLTRDGTESNPCPRNYSNDSAVKRVGLWKSFDLDIILAQKDELFKSVRINKPLAVDEFPLQFPFEGHDISCIKLSHESYLSVDMIYSKTIDITIMTKGVIFTCGGFSFATIWCVNLFILFNYHSRNIDGFNDPNGGAVLLEFRTMISLNNFIKSFLKIALVCH